MMAPVIGLSFGTVVGSTRFPQLYRPADWRRAGYPAGTGGMITWYWAVSPPFGSYFAQLLG
jgi:hypothetical protein